VPKNKSDRPFERRNSCPINEHADIGAAVALRNKRNPATAKEPQAMVFRGITIDSQNPSKGARVPLGAAD
jgi:hypothetical protein